MKHKKSILEGNIIYTLFAILIGFLTGANAFSRSTSNGQQLSIIWIMSRIKDSNL